MNTSGEESKYGVEPGGCVALARHIKERCSHLRFSGLMTIGQPDYSSRPENFQVGSSLEMCALIRRQTAKKRESCAGACHNC